MKSFLLLLFGALIAISDVQTKRAEQPLVNAPVGKIRGSIISSRLGKPIYSFRGIKYADHQRFQPSTPVRDWNDVFDASEEGPSCPYSGGTLQSEDCLRLNVYTTKLPCRGENVSRPVMIFIHPGGFFSMSGQSLLFGPQYLMDQDIVLVTINHRLGTLGFLNTGDNLAPGNNGFKDQVLAFRWVKRNIAAFGGDPNSVTLWGSSSGSFSVMLHMVSPMSKNLFHRVIAMSSSAIGSEVYGSISVGGQMEIAKKQATALDCPTDSTRAILSCLSTKSIEDFTDSLAPLYDWRGNGMLWKPVVEPEGSGAERFLIEQPYDSITQGRFQQVPHILGVTENEFGGVPSLYEQDRIYGNGTLYREINGNWTTLAPIIAYYERDTPRSYYISAELKKFYFNDQPIGPSNVKQIGLLYGDSVIVFPMYRAAKIFAANSKQPVYFCKFSYQGRYSFQKWNDTTSAGVTHLDDLQYLFYIKKYFPYFESDAPEIPMVELFTDMWANFVKTGEPIPKNNDKFKNVHWSTFVPSRSNYLDINLHPTMRTDFFPERMKLWERLFPLPLSTSAVKH